MQQATIWKKCWQGRVVGTLVHGLLQWRIVVGLGTPQNYMVMRFEVFLTWDELVPVVGPMLAIVEAATKLPSEQIIYEELFNN